MAVIGVVGAGVMGVGVAQVFAQGGYRILLVDVSDEKLREAEKELRKNIRFQALFNNTKDSQNVDDILSKIKFTTDYEQLRDANYVVENVTEDWEIKRKVYARLEEVCPANCIYLVNTSCISVTKIAALTGRPNQVIGTHFMNPVPLKSSIEVIRGYHTSKSTLEKTVDLLGEIRKKCIIVNDMPGFVSNRISHLFMNEAAFVVQDQVANPTEVDEIFRSCYGHKMGPLETADLIGLDTVVKSLKVLYESFQDPKFRCCPLLQKMVDSGMLGKKSGQGFYTY
jgi:3-hydroxybutyryl-CoA dehydrogenase